MTLWHWPLTSRQHRKLRVQWRTFTSNSNLIWPSVFELRARTARTNERTDGRTIGRQCVMRHRGGRAAYYSRCGSLVTGLLATRRSSPDRASLWPHTRTRHTRWRLTSPAMRGQPPSPPPLTGLLARRRLIRRRYRPRRLVVVVVRSISSGASRTLLCPPDERPGRRSGTCPFVPVAVSPNPSSGFSVATTLILRLGHN